MYICRIYKDWLKFNKYPFKACQILKNFIACIVTIQAVVQFLVNFFSSVFYFLIFCVHGKPNNYD